MVDSSWTYTISHFDSSNSWAKTDITSDSFVRVFSDTVENEVKTAVIRIRADFGQYIKPSINGKVHIVINDRIQIEATDGAGNSIHHMFEVVRKKPIKSKREGTMLELELLGIERWLQKVNYVKRHFGTTANAVFQDLVDAYNENAAIATNLPTLVIIEGRNNLPSTIPLSLDWGVNEENIFDRMVMLVDSQSASGANFGVLDFFDLRFTTDLDDATTVNVEVFSSGDSASGFPTVTVDSDAVNTEESDGGFEEPEGTLVNAWGANGAGTLPTNYSKFRSREILMPTNRGSDSLFPEWDDSFSYKTGSLVKYTAGAVNKCYEAIRDNSNKQPDTYAGVDWTELNVDTYAGDYTYSPWTQSNHIKWKISGGDPSGGGVAPFGPAMFDANIIVNDENTFQTWVDVKATSPAGINGVWKYGGTTLYDGFRVLVTTPATGDFSGFDNQVMEYNQGEWRQKYTTVTDMMCAVIDDALVYKFNGSTWQSLATDANGLHCFHPMDGGTTSNDKSLILKSDGSGNEYTTNNTNSSVKVSYTWTPLVGWTDEWANIIKDLAESAGFPTTQDRNTVDWYKAGAWLCLRFPIPRNSFGGAGAVGELYGGSTSTNIVPYLDAQNMHLTSGGRRGFNHGDESEEYGQLSSIDFMIKLKMTRTHTTLGEELVSKGNFKMRCVVIDANDNVATQEFVITHNNNQQGVSLPISGFEIYRGRRPLFEDGFGINDIIPPEGRPNFRQFEWRHVTAIIIQTQESYDDFGRYRGASDNDMATGSPFWEELQNVISSFKLEMWVDAFRFGKPLLVNSGQVTDLDNQPDFLQRPDIENYEQLKSDAKAELEKLKFQKKIYQLRTQVEFNIKPGEFFYFKDTELVDEDDDPSDVDNSSIKLVARHIDYSVSKSRGFERIITAARRFE